jgi:F420-dependent oxidoreductase-like protein
MDVTRFGLQIPSFTYPGVSDHDLFDRVADIAGAAEESGFDSVWVMDHFYQIATVGPRTDSMLEAYTLLGALAARTEKVSLGTMVTGVTYRNPALLAKEVTTLDIISRGRAILGIGAAWNEEEHVGYGFDFPPLGERLDRLEEALQICRAMFTEEAPSFSGHYYRIREALNFPRPLRPEGIPILVGGSGERRTLALVAKYADACNLFGDLATVRHKLDVLERHCDAVGRDPATITKTRLGSLVIADTAEEAEAKAQALAQARGMDDERLRAYTTIGDPDAVREEVSTYLDAGLDGLVFNMFDAHELDPVRLAGETHRKAFPVEQRS